MDGETMKAFSLVPPSRPWGINFGGGLNSTAMIIECRNRGLIPDWILFADTGSELPGTLNHVESMKEWCTGWAELTVVRWIRQDGSFESIHDNALRTHYLPSKAYGHAGCTWKWKIAPMDKWRKAHGFDYGCFAVGYDAGEQSRIKKACQRGDDLKLFPWYPLAAWGIDRAGCKAITESAGFYVGKSSCFMCPNMRKHEWDELKINHPSLYGIALKIEDGAAQSGNMRGHVHWTGLRNKDRQGNLLNDITDDRCAHGGCFT